MDCAEFEKIVHDLGRPGTQGAVVCETALAHAELCSRCAALLTQVEWLEFSLSKLSEQSASLQAPPRIEAALVGEFRREKTSQSQKQIRSRLAALGAAAAILLALGLSLHHRMVTSAPPASTVMPQIAAQAPEAGPVAPAINSRPETPQPTKPAAPVVRKFAAAADTSEAEETASFVRLPYADDSMAFDGGAIVRVEMPRAALASFGLPVADFGGSDRVPVDLVVSADGTPQAIRLVSQLGPSQEF